MLPHWGYRVSFSLFADLHMIAMLVVSKQLRHTIRQIDRSFSIDGDEFDAFSNAIMLCKRYALDIFVYAVVIGDVAFAILDSLRMSDGAGQFIVRRRATRPVQHSDRAARCDERVCVCAA